MPVFFIHSSQVSGETLQITDSLALHISGALRHRPGDTIFTIDERQNGYLVELVEVKAKRIWGKILEVKKQPSRPRPKIFLGQAMLKGKKMDWVLQKATELGVTQIIPLVTERTIVDPKPDRIIQQQNRWKEIIKEAAQQSERWEIPELAPPVEYPKIFQSQQKFDLSFVPWEKEPHNDLKKLFRQIPRSNPTPSILVLIGPEGGFRPGEIEMAVQNRVIPVSLGPRILRSETAAMATLAILQYELGEMSCA